MAKIAPTTITLDPTQTLTLNLKPNPELSSQTVALVALADRVAVTSFADSVEASAFLARVQHLRRWVTGIYKDAKGRVMGLIVAFTAAEAAREAAREAAALTQHLAGAPVEITAPAPVAVIDGMQSRTTYSATVTDVRALVLAVAGQLLLETPGATKVTQGWLRRVCAPTPQCTLALLEPAAPALNALARALRTDLAVPGTTLASITTLVAR